MVWQTTAPAAVDGLVQALAAAKNTDPDMASVDVRDGPVLASTSALEVLSVGWSGTDESTGVDGQLAREGLGPDREQTLIRSVIGVASGSTGVAAARRRAYEILVAAGRAWDASRTLGGAVMTAYLGSHSLDYQQGERGLEVILTFEVLCDGYAG